MLIKIIQISSANFIELFMALNMHHEHGIMNSRPKGFLLSYGFVNSHNDTSLFIYRTSIITVYFLVYVDDLIVIGNDTTFITQFMQALATRFSVKDLGDLNYFLSIEVFPTTFVMHLTQHTYILDLLTNTCPVPRDAPPRCLLHNHYLFMMVLHRLMLRNFDKSLVHSNISLTRPEISYVVNKLAQFMHSLSEIHWSTTKRVLRYLKSIIYHGLFLKSKQHLHVTAFTNADYAENRDDRTSTSSYIIYLGGNVISWCSKKQKSVAHSSTEAEYQAFASCAAEVLWIKNLLSELHVPCSIFPQLFCDNIGSTYLFVNFVFHS